MSLAGMWKGSPDFLVPRLCQRQLSNIYSPPCDVKGTGRELVRNRGISRNLLWRLLPLSLLCPMGLRLAPAFTHGVCEQGQSQELTVDP